MAEDIKKDTAEKLVRARKEKGYTQKDMAGFTGMQVSNISRMEQGEQNLSLDTINKYCSVLGKSAEFVVRDSAENRYGSENTKYDLRLFDERLISFEMRRKGHDIDVNITYVNESEKHMLPVPLEADNESLKLWLKRRRVPVNRSYVHELLQSAGLNVRDVKGILDISKGLSLNDSYWITPSGKRMYFDECNLFDNEFSEQLGEIAFMGMAQPLYERRSSPEFTTGGMLRKAWKRPVNRQGIWLYKGGSVGENGNEGNEVYSEYYASQIAKAMGLNAVSYELEMWRGILTSCCPIFSSKEISYVPAGDLPGVYEIEDIIDFYRSLGQRFYDELCDMMIFDALVFNRDRHFLNFGLLRDNRSGEFIAPAPIFDNGLSLFPFASRCDFGNLGDYSKRANPACERSWEEIIKLTLSERQKSELKKILSFRFTEHPYYNLPEWRLHALEVFLHRRAKDIIEF